MTLTGVALSLGVAFTSHIGTNEKYNEIHPSLNLAYESYRMKVYKNSINNTSVALYYNWEVTNNTNLEVGLVSGYGDVVPFARVTYELTDKTAIFATPAVDSSKSPILVVGFGIRM